MKEKKTATPPQAQAQAQASRNMPTHYVVTAIQLAHTIPDTGMWREFTGLLRECGTRMGYSLDDISADINKLRDIALANGLAASKEQAQEFMQFVLDQHPDVVQAIENARVTARAQDRLFSLTAELEAHTGNQGRFVGFDLNFYD